LPGKNKDIAKEKMDILPFSDEYFMREALKEASKAFDEDEVPVGAVIVCNNRIIARGHNLTERLNDVTAHAEMQAFTSASNFIGGKYLEGCTLYVTLEPCVMCAGAAFWTQLDRVVYGTDDEKRGFSKVSSKILHPKTTIYGGVLREECEALLKEFFIKKR
jgi:tRNA(adenine34) deaminase